jgi:hypothetical protein
MEEKLINFLKQKRVYKKFMRNIGKTTITEIIERYEIAILKGVPANPINAAFIWGLTPEGAQFWGNISLSWEYYNQH